MHNFEGPVWSQFCLKMCPTKTCKSLANVHTSYFWAEGSGVICSFVFSSVLPDFSFISLSYYSLCSIDSRKNIFLHCTRNTGFLITQVSPLATLCFLFPLHHTWFHHWPLSVKPSHPLHPGPWWASAGPHRSSVGGADWMGGWIGGRVLRAHGPRAAPSGGACI